MKISYNVFVRILNICAVQQKIRSLHITVTDAARRQIFFVLFLLLLIKQKANSKRFKILLSLASFPASISPD